ncbi:hypothetical protein L3Q82_017408, partial [Scortum barcoo]
GVEEEEEVEGVVLFLEFGPSPDHDAELTEQTSGEEALLLLLNLSLFRTPGDDKGNNTRLICCVSEVSLARSLATSLLPYSAPLNEAAAPFASVNMTSTSQLFGLVEAGLKCDQEIERRYEIVPSVVCSMCCLFGIIYCFFGFADPRISFISAACCQPHTDLFPISPPGYRCFKAVLFLTGLMFGSVVIFMLCYKERVMDTQLSVEASVGIGLGIGTLCGLVTMLVRSVGLFMVGLLLGLLVGVASLVVMEEFYHPKTVWVPLGILLGSGTLFAVLTLQWQRCFVTFSTATFGSAIITVTVDYFIELFALVHYVYERLRVGSPVCLSANCGPEEASVLVYLGHLGGVACPGPPRSADPMESHCRGIFSHRGLHPTMHVVLSRQQRRVQLMRIRQREERLKKEKENKKKKKRQTQKTSHKQKAHTHHHHHQQYHHPGASHLHHQAQSSQPPKVPPPQTEPGYHRKVNPKRRFDGDVLSPSYIRSFRDRQTDRRAYSHSRMMSRSRMGELDYDCGSQVPLTAPSGPPVRI